MINNFPPNIGPNSFAFSASIIGAIISEEFDYYELESIGNWLMLLAQYLLAYAAQEQLIQMRNNPGQNTPDLDYIKNALKKIEIEIEKLKKEV